jgi:hypothetical protein
VATRAARALADGDALSAVRLCEMALAVDAVHRAALETYRDAHEQLLAEHAATSAGGNFWLTRWLEGEIASATNRLAGPT